MQPPFIQFLGVEHDVFNFVVLGIKPMAFVHSRKLGQEGDWPGACLQKGRLTYWFLGPNDVGG